MMYWIFQYFESLSDPSDIVKVFNVFKYQSFRGATACLLSFLLVGLFGERVIRKLISMKIGQPIRTAEEVRELYELHGKKAGTPTMGGVLFLGAVVISTLVCARMNNPFVGAVLFVFSGHALLGMSDDYKKIVKNDSKGVSARGKLIIQLGIAVVAGLFLYLPDHDIKGYAPGVQNPVPVRDYIAQLHVPFMKEPLIENMGIYCILFFAVVIVGCSNAVNLTDGLDGLATGCTITVASAYGLLAYLVGRADVGQYLFTPYHVYSGEVAIVCLALVGASMGFLWFNCHPARVFMGDTGSLAIGGLLGMTAICCKHEVLLVLIGGVFVIEAMSVILQVGSFKLRGKRIFKMAPIHHHFELKGWHESQVIVRFWIISIIFALLGLATLKLR